MGVVSRRSIGGRRRLIRTRLPKYKKNLGSLPPLTELLTRPDEHTHLNGPIKLRLEKLSVYKQFLPIGSNTNLIEALFNPDNDIDRLLNIISDNLETMNSFYVGVSFEVLDDMVRAQLCDPATIIVAPEFRKLCEKALYKIRYFEADEVIKLIKCSSSLGLPENTLLVRAGLEMARHLINDFNLDELDALYMSLDTFRPIESKDKSLLLVLKAAIPHAQNRQLDEKQFIKLSSGLPKSRRHNQ